MKRITKVLSVILAVLMCFSLVTPAFAAEDSNDKYPTIYVNGMMSSPVYTDTENPTERVNFPENEEIISMLKDKIVPALLIYGIDRDFDKLAHEVSDSVNSIFVGWANNPDGTAAGNSGTIMEYPAPSSINKDSFIQFYYDWRGDPLVIASELKAFVEYVKASAGTDKVALTCHSLGSIMVLSYISLYGTEDIYGIVFDSPAMEGITYVGELLKGEAELNGEGILTFLKCTMTENQYNELITSCLDVLELAGIPDMLSESLNDLIDRLAPVIYKETLIPMFVYWLTIWAMVPDDMVDDSMKFVFDEYCKDEDLSVLKGKITAYNTLVRKNRREKLLSFDNSGKLAVISRYGFSSLPLTPSWSVESDTVVDTKSASLGATTAPAGEIFSDEYLEGKDMKYISPDKRVDASTCLFPEKTWFIKNINHNDTKFTRQFYAPLLFSGEEATCDNFTLSRFSVYNSSDNNVKEDNSVSAPTVKKSPLVILMNFLTAIMNFFRNLLNR
ncbi:MAG: hypothetical protein IJ262_05120 [Clostridia bacterium]|nr:hypothetical protein [Clostridia bacterium]